MIVEILVLVDKRIALVKQMANLNSGNRSATNDSSYGLANLTYYGVDFRFVVNYSIQPNIIANWLMYS